MFWAALLHRRAIKSSEWTDGKIAQPQIGIAALFPDPEQRPVQRLTQQVVALRPAIPMPSPKNLLSTNGPPENAQHSAESVPLIQNASEIPSPKMKSTSPRRSAERSASSFG